jgi:DNA repair exonuclease SbcCD ATPase subunit
VKKAIHKISDTLKIFDGEIDISKNIVQKDFESIEEIKEKLEQAKAELKSQEQLLDTVKDMEKSQSDLQVILNEIETIKIKLQKIKSKPSILKNIEKLKGVITEINTQKEHFENELKAINKKIAQKSNELNEINDEIKKRGDRIAQLQDFKRELESLGLVADEDFESTEDLDLLYNKIKLNQNDRFTLKINKDNLFEKLRDKLQSTFADEQDFIRYVEEEIALIDDKERSIQSLLESISTQFANPAYTLLKRYDEFKEFINNKFNHKLSQSRISDIESLTIELVDNKKLVEEVKKISQIQQVKGQLMFEFDHSENLKILDAYLESGKKIDFENLFDITLHLTRKGSTKPVDLNEQIESDGTDKMIRLMIVMNIINRLAIADDENRIVLFIDEVATIDKQNRPELVRFCREHYFIPIFAAPDAVAGFGKYYFIYPNSGKINVNEKVNAMYGESNTVLAR